STHSPAGGERVFSDAKGRLWSAAHAGEVIIFTCISDGRHAGRAMVVNVASLDNTVGDDALRAWLRAAPRIRTPPEDECRNQAFPRESTTMREYKGSEIRNIAVVGHGASGKTSLVDALAFVSGSSKRHGSVKDGTALTDFAPEETERGFSINLACAYAE